MESEERKSEQRKKKYSNLLKYEGRKMLKSEFVARMAELGLAEEGQELLAAYLEGSAKGDGRKGELLELMKEEPKGLLILDISKRMGISTRNVSSLLTYLRKDGWDIWTDGCGRKLLKGKIEEVEEVEVEVEAE